MKQRSFFLVVAVISLPIFVLSCAPKLSGNEVRSSMGTFCEIKIAGTRPDTARKLIDSAFQELSRVESLMSLYLEGSDISKVNRLSSMQPVNVSPETFYCLEKSKEVSFFSKGAFDVTVLPLIKVWGFMGDNPKRPDVEKINFALLHVGYSKLILSSDDSTVRFDERGMGVDLGGVAKGYGADQAVRALRKAGCRNALVNLGGTIYAFGLSQHGKKWRVGLRHPRKRGKIFYSLDLNEKAISTSGDYENFFVEDGVRYSHIIDPRTGYPPRNNVFSVSVIAPSGLEADALSTAVFVEGLEEGMKLIEAREGVEAIVVVEDTKGQLWAHFSRGFGEPQPIKL